MKINLAVYTARDGYAWQPGSAYSASELDEFKVAIGKMPVIGIDDLPKRGVVRVGDRVLYYCCRVAKAVDIRGRDALYCVIGAIPSEDAETVEEELLFAAPEFSTVMIPFPTVMKLRTHAGVGKIITSCVDRISKLWRIIK